jgi:hypothetical protein
MIKDKNELIQRGINIDLSGPEGNAYVLLGLAKKLGKQLEKDHVEIIARMTSGDYENLIKVFEAEFGDIVTLYR